MLIISLIAIWYNRSLSEDEMIYSLLYLAVMPAISDALARGVMGLKGFTRY